MSSIRIKGKTIRRAKTNEGDLCKQVFIVLEKNGKDPAIAVRKFSVDPNV